MNFNLKLTDPSYPAFPILSFLSFLLVLVPLPWHWQAWNSGTCLFMFWTALGCLNLFVNSIVWHKNVIDWAPIWCDISSRIIIGVSIAIPATSLCINRRLHSIATCQAVSTSKAERRRAVYIDLLIGLGIPVLQMILQCVVQGHRYDIFEDIGCYPTSVNTPLAYPLSFVWSNVLSLASAVYGILTLRAFLVRRAQFSQFLSHNSALTMSRYFRLMALATLEICISVPICTFTLVYNIVSRPMVPYTSWDFIHADFFIISTYPTVLWRMTPASEASMEVSRWSIVLCGFLFFGFFGFADEAQRSYKKAFNACLRVLGLGSFKPRKSMTTKSKIQPPTLPVYKINSFPTVDTAISSTTPPSPSKEERCFSPYTTASESLDGSVTIAPSSPPAYTYKLEPLSASSDSYSSRLSRSTI